MIRIVALGGTVNPASTTEQSLAVAANVARADDVEFTFFGGDYLAALPHYRGNGHSSASGEALVAAARAADGLIIAAPGYHGTISGLVKNALDYFEDLAKDERPYLDGRAVGLITTAYGDQAAMSTLLTMRAIVHALRGWPTPMGATLRTYQGMFSPDGECLDDRARNQLEMVGRQVLFGARSFAAQKDRA